MNYKFLCIIYILQCSLFAINIPHERPIDNQEEMAAKKQKLDFTEELMNIIKNNNINFFLIFNP